MVSYKCKGRAREFEMSAEVFRTGLVLAEPPLRPASSLHLHIQSLEPDLIGVRKKEEETLKRF